MTTRNVAIQRLDAMLASCEAYAGAVQAGLLPLAAAADFTLHNVEHDAFLKVVDHYGVKIDIFTDDPNHQWASAKIPLYADPSIFAARLVIYSGTTTQLAYRFPLATPAFLDQCRAHNRDCLTTDAPDHDHRELKPSILTDKEA